MKRFSIILFGALAILVAGCSKNNPQLPPEEAWIDDLSLPVPIQFGSSKLMTKAPIDELADLEGKTLGILGVDKRPEADWSSMTSESVLLSNVKGVYATDDGGNGYIDFLNGPYYYPISTLQNFSFYGYYIYDVEMEYEGEAEAGGYYIPVVLGKYDLLWSKAEAVGDGYNASYVRENKKMVDGDLPTFNFRHVTAGLEFLAVANAQDGETDDDFKNILVREVYVSNAYTTAKLCVAHKEDVGKDFEHDAASMIEGKLHQPGTPDILRVDGRTGMTYSPTKAGTIIGSGLFMYPSNAGYDVNVVIQRGAASNRDTLVINTGPVEQGIKYRYKLKFNKLQDVKIFVESVEWSSTSETDINVEEELTNAGS